MSWRNRPWQWRARKRSHLSFPKIPSGLAGLHHQYVRIRFSERTGGDRHRLPRVARVLRNDYHKQRVIRAQPQDTMLTDIFHINWPIGARVRVLQNSVTRGERGEPFGPSRIIGEEEGRPIYLFSTDSPLRSMSGDFEGMALYAGQGVGRINAIVPAGERFAAIVGEAAQLLRKPASALGDSARRTSSAGRPPHGRGQG